MHCIIAYFFLHAHFFLQLKCDPVQLFKKRSSKTNYDNRRRADRKAILIALIRLGVDQTRRKLRLNQTNYGLHHAISRWHRRTENKCILNADHFELLYVDMVKYCQINVTCDRSPPLRFAPNRLDRIPAFSRLAECSIFAQNNQCGGVRWPLKR